MKLVQITEIENSGSEWENQGPPSTMNSLRKKMLSLAHQADLILNNLQLWTKTKTEKSKVFTVTGPKGGITLPKHVQLNPRQYLVWTLTHSNPNIITKVFVDKDDPKIILPIRALITRHNNLTDARADIEGRLVKIKAQK